ncbi:DUF4283 domain-containing protein [Raphanus sativus]|nr:DUF4283 domain-containing protein [Raphanus sativus]
MVTLDLVEAASQSPWKGLEEGAHLNSTGPRFEVKNGIADLQIPEAVLGSDPLWKAFVVGYFIGDAPHVGSIHATVNRIWSIPGNKVKIDVQFISKTTVLFRIENDGLRQMVLRRKYWHVADIPLVVNVWTPETAASPPDLTAMPLWVDFKGVLSYLFSHKGLKCVSSPVGNFVKLHPFTERCTRLDVARVLLEVNLHDPLVEKVIFTDRNGVKVEVEVIFSWLPTRCNLCSRWGHKGSECTSKQIVILQNSGEDQEVGVQGEGGEASAQHASSVGALLAELEAFPVLPTQTNEEAKNTTDVVEGEELGVQKEGDGRGKELNGMVDSERVVTETGEKDLEEWNEIPYRNHPSLVDPEVSKVSFDVKALDEDPKTGTVSPSHFHVLGSLSEEDESDEKEEEEGLEEGEVSDVPEKTRASVKQKGLQEGASVKNQSKHVKGNKSARKPARTTRDLKLQNMQGHSKNTSFRKA